MGGGSRGRPRRRAVRVWAAVAATAGTMLLGAASTGAPRAPYTPFGDAAVAAGYHLLGYLPPVVQHTCSLGRPADDPPVEAQQDDVVAELYCYPADGTQVTYVQLSSPAALTQLYDRYLPRNFAPQLFAPASDCEFQGTWSSNGNEAGRQVCYRSATSSSPHQVSLAWTYDQANILGLAWRDDGDPAQLRSFWSNAGPVAYQQPAFSPPNPSKGGAVAATLLAHFPASIRSHGRCASVNLRSPSALGAEYDWRLWVSGEMDCHVTGLPVADVTYDQFTDRDALDAYLRYFSQFNGTSPTPAQQAAGCVNNTYTQAGQPAGAYSCGATRGDTTNHTKRLLANIEWSNDPTVIGAFAARNDNNAAALMQWWRGGQSGPLRG